MITGNAGNNVLNGAGGLQAWASNTRGSTAAGADTLVGGAGDDVYFVNGSALDPHPQGAHRQDDLVVEQAGDGYDTIVLDGNAFASVAVLPANVERLLGFDARVLVGNELDNIIQDHQTITGSNPVLLDGGTGADTLIGSMNPNVYFVDNPGDVVDERGVYLDGTEPDVKDTIKSSIDFVLGQYLEDLVLTGSAAIAGTGNDKANDIDGSQNSAPNTLTGGKGDDTYRIGIGDVVAEAPGEGIDTIRFSPSSVGIIDVGQYANVERFMTAAASGGLRMSGASPVSLLGRAGADIRLEGGAGDDFIQDYDHITDALNAPLEDRGSDTLVGGAGADTIISVRGDDWLDGGTGNDLLTGTQIVFAHGYGHDTATNGALGVHFGAGVAPGDLTLQREGTALVISLNGGMDSLTLENQLWALEGTLRKSLSLTFFDGQIIDGALINQWLTGGVAAPTAGNDNLAGTSLGDTINGLAGDDTIDGRAGNDVLDGGPGDDTLDGGTGIDSMFGGEGNDKFVVDATADATNEAADEGWDYVVASVDWTLAANIEGLYLAGGATRGTGNALNNYIQGTDAAEEFYGLAGDDMLNGGLGDDRMLGGTGDDVYLVNDIGDVVVEAPGEGSDTVRLYSNDPAVYYFTLPDNVENLDASGDSLNHYLGGNALANVLTGGVGNDALNGGAGADTLIGGAGNDTYYVHDLADMVIEESNGGTDTVLLYPEEFSFQNFTLPQHVENVDASGHWNRMTMVGNALANVLTGGGQNDDLDGGGGTDTMIGGRGNDTYVVDNAGDVIIELDAEGVDLTQSSVTHTLAANVENLTLTGATAINGTGNTLNNVLVGNSAVNTLTGGAGNDTMIGGAGNDTYFVDSVSDVVTENLNEGTDTIITTVTLATLAANVENLTLSGGAALNATGNTLANVITGNSAANTLNGDSGADTMIGGAGNDTYVVDSAGDVITELVSEGVDLVQSSVTHSLAANVENLTLTGTTAINGTGNTLDNALTGNSANNTLTGGAGNDILDGGLGNDTMVGGAGNDTYVVNVATDVVSELLGEGTDTVNSAVTLTLGANVENLTLTGSTAINGTGNTLNNVLVGNSAVNTLTGGAGNDTMDGRAGNDTMVGGEGADSYLFGRGWGIDTVQENDIAPSVVDKVLFGSGIARADTSYARNGNNLEVSILGTSDKLIVMNWYLGLQYQIEQFEYADGSTIGNSQLASMVSAMATFTQPAAVTAGSDSTAMYWRGTDFAPAIM